MLGLAGRVWAYGLGWRPINYQVCEHVDWKLTRALIARQIGN